MLASLFSRLSRLGKIFPHTAHDGRPPGASAVEDEDLTALEFLHNLLDDFQSRESILIKAEVGGSLTDIALHAGLVLPTLERYLRNTPRALEAFVAGELREYCNKVDVVQRLHFEKFEAICYHSEQSALYLEELTLLERALADPDNVEMLVAATPACGRAPGHELCDCDACDERLEQARLVAGVAADAAAAEAAARAAAARLGEAEGVARALAMQELNDAITEAAEQGRELGEVHVALRRCFDLVRRQAAEARDGREANKMASRECELGLGGLLVMTMEVVRTTDPTLLDPPTRARVLEKLRILAVVGSARCPRCILCHCYFASGAAGDPQHCDRCAACPACAALRPDPAARVQKDSAPIRGFYPQAAAAFDPPPASRTSNEVLGAAWQPWQKGVEIDRELTIVEERARVTDVLRRLVAKLKDMAPLRMDDAAEMAGPLARFEEGLRRTVDFIHAAGDGEEVRRLLTMGSVSLDLADALGAVARAERARERAWESELVQTHVAALRQRLLDLRDALAPRVLEADRAVAAPAAAAIVEAREAAEAAERAAAEEKAEEMWRRDEWWMTVVYRHAEGRFYLRDPASRMLTRPARM